MLDYTKDALDLASLLLGARFTVRGPAGVVSVRLTEVEAYEGERDPGSHGFRGPTLRTEAMFRPGGRIYVYFTYGMHWCCNVVCGPEGRASAVLLRGGEIVEGVELARHRRTAARRDIDLARGPARMAQALGLSGEDNGLVLSTGGRAELTPPAEAAGSFHQGPRVGVSGRGGDAAEFPWRFWLPDEQTVSTYRPAAPRRRRTTGTTTPKR